MNRAIWRGNTDDRLAAKWLPVTNSDSASWWRPTLVMAEDDAANPSQEPANLKSAEWTQRCSLLFGQQQGPRRTYGEDMFPGIVAVLCHQPGVVADKAPVWKDSSACKRARGHSLPSEMRAYRLPRCQPPPPSLLTRSETAELLDKPQPSNHSSWPSLLIGRHLAPSLPPIFLSTLSGFGKGVLSSSLPH